MLQLLKKNENETVQKQKGGRTCGENGFRAKTKCN
jgi:hypothetical protein